MRHNRLQNPHEAEDNSSDSDEQECKQQESPKQHKHRHHKCKHKKPVTPVLPMPTPSILTNNPSTVSNNTLFRIFSDATYNYYAYRGGVSTVSGQFQEVNSTNGYAFIVNATSLTTVYIYFHHQHQPALPDGSIMAVYTSSPTDTTIGQQVATTLSTSDGTNPHHHQPFSIPITSPTKFQALVGIPITVDNGDPIVLKNGKVSAGISNINPQMINNFMAMWLNHVQA